MIIAMKDLELEELVLIYPGEKSFILDNNIRAIGLQNYLLSNA